ncbi:DUF3558 family protein [Saccharomonospora iraqiensis]|uniref:DUF3558 family protein n=1 Tax=Saccharomonospora iraqiensis TaxID=52698 RepID=UPI0012F9A4C3|nr:DUF3558 family protein [Saccharomonospora iraqiensis]
MAGKKELLMWGALTLTVLLGGCSDTRDGSASPADHSPAAGSAPSETQSPSPSHTSSERSATIDSCALLDPTELARFGDFGPPTRDNLAGARACYFTPERDGTERRPTITVALRDSQGVASANDQGMGITQATFNGRDAAQIPDKNDVCIIALGLTESSRVDVGVSGIDTDEACDLVERVTEIVEPKLPEPPR